MLFMLLSRHCCGTIVQLMFVKSIPNSREVFKKFLSMHNKTKEEKQGLTEILTLTAQLPCVMACVNFLTRDLAFRNI